jgi:hypothetical protein
MSQQQLSQLEAEIAKLRDEEVFTRDIIPASQAIAALIKFTVDTKEPFNDPQADVAARWAVEGGGCCAAF